MLRMLFLILFLFAGAESALSQTTRYINAWGSDDINDHEWQPYSEEAANQIGINEVSIYPPGTEPTPEQAKAAEDLIKRTREAAKRHNWFKFGESLKEGYEAHDVSHYLNVEYAKDEHVLDPDRPENLMYYWTREGELKLVGVMYLLRSNTEQGPQLGGPLTTWHFHTVAAPFCWWDGSYKIRNADGSCHNGEPTTRSAEMLHVWLVDHPDGPFATSMHVPQEVVDALP